MKYIVIDDSYMTMTNIPGIYLVRLESLRISEDISVIDRNNNDEEIRFGVCKFSDFIYPLDEANRKMIYKNSIQGVSEISILLSNGESTRIYEFENDKIATVWFLANQSDFFAPNSGRVVYV